jgi:hypothetical protein
MKYVEQTHGWAKAQVQVSDDVIRILQPHREPHKVVCDSHPHPVLNRKGGVAQHRPETFHSEYHHVVCPDSTDVTLETK